MSLFLVGGPPDDRLGEVWDAFVAEAREQPSGSGRIALAMLGPEQQARRYLPGYADPIAKRWPEAKLEPIWLNEDDEDATNWPEAPEDLAGLVVGGGYTPGYHAALMPRKAMISKLVRRGVPYMGFSAGAMITAKYAIVGGYLADGRQVCPKGFSEGLDELTVRDGLALIGPGVDVHTDAASSLGRAVAAVQAGAVRSCVSIDEGTALVIDADSGRSHVLGAGQITWLSRDGNTVLLRTEQSISRNTQD